MAPTVCFVFVLSLLRLLVQQPMRRQRPSGTTSHPLQRNVLVRTTPLCPATSSKPKRLVQYISKAAPWFSATTNNSSSRASRRYTLLVLTPQKIRKAARHLPPILPRPRHRLTSPDIWPTRHHQNSTHRGISSTSLLKICKRSNASTGKISTLNLSPHPS